MKRGTKNRIPANRMHDDETVIRAHRNAASLAEAAASLGMTINGLSARIRRLRRDGMDIPGRIGTKGTITPHVRKYLERYAEGESFVSIAGDYGVTPQAVSAAIGRNGVRRKR